MKNRQSVNVFESLSVAIKTLPRAILPLTLLIIVGFAFSYFGIYVAEIIEPQSLVLGGIWFILCNFTAYLISSNIVNVSIKRVQKKKLQLNQFFHAFKPSVAWRLLMLGIIPLFLYQVWFKFVIKNVSLYHSMFNLDPNSVYDWVILPYYISSMTQIAWYYGYLILTSVIAIYISTRTFMSICFVLDKNTALIASLKQAFLVTRNNVSKIVLLAFIPALIILMFEIGLILLCNFLLQSIIWQYPLAYYYFVMTLAIVCTLLTLVFANILIGVIYVKLSK